jgi:hypothetical protein
MIMFKGRPGFARTTLVAAAGVSCLAIAACGSSNSASAGAAPSASSTVDPLAGLSAAKVQAKTVADAEAASSVTMKGSITQSGQSFTVNLAIKPGHGCTGTIGMGAKGNLKLIVINKTVYLNPDNTFWNANSGADAATVIALVDGRYIEAPASNSDMAPWAQLCDVSQLFSSNGSPSGPVREAVTTLNGTRVVPLKGPNGMAYVTDTSTPELVQLSAPKSAKNGSGLVTVTMDVPVTLTAPPASQVIDGSKLGM